MFTLAFLTDPHIAPLPAPSLRELMGKRLLGYLNWRMFRKTIHLRQVLDALVEDLLAQRPDHIAVGGDLVNLSLKREFGPALEWLQALGPPERVSLVPGNHDAYVPMNPNAGLERWRAYMRSFGANPVAPAANGFPWVRVVGEVALVGLCSGVPKPAGFASGQVGEEQIAALGGALRRLGQEGLFRVVMVHHPPLVGFSDPRRGLDDAEAVQETLRVEGVELVLFGHRHFQSVDRLECEGGMAPVVGAPSASSTRLPPEFLARYALFRIARRRGGWRCDLTWRGLKAPAGKMMELESLALIEAAASRSRRGTRRRQRAPQ